MTDDVQQRIDADRAYLREAEQRANANAQAIRDAREAQQPDQGPHRQSDWNPTEPNLPMPKP